jgi:hypothetical protein
MEAFPTQDGLKQGALSPSLFNVAIQCVSRKLHKNQARLELSGIHQLLIYDDDNLLYSKMQIKWTCY